MVKQKRNEEYTFEKQREVVYLRVIIYKNGYGKLKLFIEEYLLVY